MSKVLQLIYTLDIQKDFGWIKDYQAPKVKHPSSIMNLSSTGGKHGRGDQSSDIVGKVILHGKKEFWGIPQMHYHQGMKAGENTLNAVVSRVLLRDLIAKKGYFSESYIDSYINFMTTPDSHNDTYAESYHRDFFTNYAQGNKPMECAGKEDHNSASMGAFVSLPILILFLHYSHQSRATILQKCITHMKLTHTSESLNEFAEVFVNLMLDILCFPVHPIPESNLIDLFVKAGKNIPDRNPMDILSLLDQYGKDNDSSVIGGLYSSACYISDSLPSILYLGAKYSQYGIIKGLLANANVGGDNCHRGAALGALLGAALGYKSIDPVWINGLVDEPVLSVEINKFIACLESNSD